MWMISWMFIDYDAEMLGWVIFTRRADEITRYMNTFHSSEGYVFIFIQWATVSDGSTYSTCICL